MHKRLIPLLFILSGCHSGHDRILDGKEEKSSNTNTSVSISTGTFNFRDLFDLINDTLKKVDEVTK